MPWTSVRVRPASLDDLPALLELGDELRDQVLPVEGGTGRVRAASMAGRAALAARYSEAVTCADRHLVLAVCDGTDGDEVLGMAMLTVASANALLDIPAVHMSHAVVPDRHRRRGAGKALVAAAAAFAEERGIEQLVVSVHPGSRDAARFFARLGFAPMAVRRTAPVSLVRRKLSATERTVEVVARRRPRRVLTAPRAALPTPRVDGADS